MFFFTRTPKMLSVLFLVSLALFTQTITSLPSALSSGAELPENFNLEPDGLSPITNEIGMSSSDLIAPSVDDSDAFPSNPLALNVDFSASVPPASQNNADPGCGGAQKGKRQIDGSTACPAGFKEKEPGAASGTPKTTLEGQQPDPTKPGAPDNLSKQLPSWLEHQMQTRLRGPLKVEYYDSNSCPNRYAFTVCGIHEPLTRWTWEKLSSVEDADLCMSSFFYVAFLILESLALTACTRDRGWFVALRPGTKKHVVLQCIQCIRKFNAFRSLLTLSWSICVV